MTTTRNFSRPVKRSTYARANGCCESCGVYLPAGFGGIVYDHRILWKLSEDSSIDNCQMLCTACDSAKTYGKDLTEIAKVMRVADERIGIKRSSKKLPAGRNSGIKKKINGEVVRRLERYEGHHAVMAKFQNLRQQ
jgi:CRISPR/Cas system-associated protein Cas10 (large subunit of type III CRISPR-Cas system)